MTRGPAQPLSQRFWSKVDRAGGPDACWLWMASVNKVGYGQFGVAGTMLSAHRVAWTLTHGEIPPGEGHHGTCVLHRCDVRTCVNPAHLFLGSAKDNTSDMLAKDRAAKGEAHGNSKLTKAQVEAICLDPRSQARVAADYGISQTQVHRIRRGECWGWATQKAS